MEEQTSKLPAWVQRIFKNEDSVIGNLVVWYLAFTVFPAGGFYFGTIFSPASNAHGIRHYYDLHVEDIHWGGWFALVGLAIGICFGLWITFGYPRIKELDAIEDQAVADRIHAMAAAHGHPHHEHDHSSHGDGTDQIPEDH